MDFWEQIKSPGYVLLALCFHFFEAARIQNV